VIVLGLDQGTSSTRCVALDSDLREVGAASVPVVCSFPAPGLVEQDPEAIAESARAAIAGALGGRDQVAARRAAEAEREDAAALAAYRAVLAEGAPV
jgi:glycerol kinase